MSDHGPVLGVSALVTHGGSVLVVRRGRGPLAGRWSLPGGKVRTGETLAQALTREVAEETGLRVDVGEVAGVREQIGWDGHYVIAVHHAEVTGGRLQPSSDAADARWVTGDELRSLQLTPGLMELLRDAGVA